MLERRGLLVGESDWRSTRRNDLWPLPPRIFAESIYNLHQADKSPSMKQDSVEDSVEISRRISRLADVCS